MNGVSSITELELDDADLPLTLDLAVCLDVSAVSLTGPDGESFVAPDRVDVQSLRVTLSSTLNDRKWQVSGIEGRDGAPTC